MKLTECLIWVLKKIIRKIVEERDMPGPEFRQTIMCSATFPTDIRQLATDFLRYNHLFLKVGTVGTTESITQTIKLVNERDKQKEIIKDLQEVRGRTLVFAETKRTTDTLARFLFAQGFNATGIHGDRSQNEREAALRKFKSGKIQVLVATDVAARGLDIEEVTHVINYDLPKTLDSYIHRIGRTGRAGNLGKASSYYNSDNRGIAADLLGLLKDTNQVIPPFLASAINEPRYKKPTGGAMRRGYGGSGGSSDRVPQYGQSRGGGTSRGGSHSSTNGSQSSSWGSQGRSNPSYGGTATSTSSYPQQNRNPTPSYSQNHNGTGMVPSYGVSPVNHMNIQPSYSNSVPQQFINYANPQQKQNILPPSYGTPQNLVYL